MAEKPAFHEDFGRERDVKVGSERAFGLVFAGVFTLIALWPLWGGANARLWALIVAAALAVAAAVVPRALRPLNVLWFRFGMLLHKVVTPAVMGLLFYATVTPTAMLMRLCRKDPLRLHFDRSAKSYWIERVPPGPAPETMRHQF